MPSPFPGMDPYLEGEMWQEFHDRLVNAISAQLMPLVSPKYVALLNKRYVIDRSSLGLFGSLSEKSVYPDVHVVAPPGAPSLRPSAGPATLTPPTTQVTSPMSVPQLSIEVRDVAERRLVALIELLSPANKHGEGARDYDERRVSRLQTKVHLLEIDLLRDGQRLALAEPLPPAPYYVFLSPTQNRPFTAVWAVGLRDRLPVVPVPLLWPDPDVALDLQAAVTSCFALVGYERLLDYTVPPPAPPLPPDDAAWVAEQIRSASRAG